MPIKILDKDEQLLKGLTGELLTQINKKVNAGVPKIANATKNIIQKRLEASPEYQELSAPSKTTALFGFPYGMEKQIIDAVIIELLNNVEVKFSPFRMFGLNVKGEISILLNWGKVLDSSAAKLQTDSGELLWFEWLSVLGDRLIVDQYSFLYTPARTFSGSRSRNGLMIRGNAKAARVDPRFSGVATSNFLHRALNDDFANELGQVVFGLII